MLALVFAPTAAASAATRGLGDRDETGGGNGLDFDHTESTGCGLKGEFCGVEASLAQDVQNLFLTIERPFEIDQFQIQAPLFDACTPLGECLFALTRSIAPGIQIEFRGTANQLEFGYSFLRGIEVGFQAFQDRTQLKSTIGFNHHVRSTSG